MVYVPVLSEGTSQRWPRAELGAAPELNPNLVGGVISRVDSDPVRSPCKIDDDIDYVGTFQFLNHSLNLPVQRVLWLVSNTK